MKKLFALILVSAFLIPTVLGQSCTTNSDCNDGDPCTTDACTSGTCTYALEANCCGNELCETGYPAYENCDNCADCSCSDGEVCEVYRAGSDAKGCYDITLDDGYCDPGETNCEDCGCDPNKQCDTETHDCVQCITNTHCAYYHSPNRKCDAETHTCVECLQDTDCSYNQVCDTNTNECVECVADSDCASGMVCDTTRNSCVECVDDNDCPGQYCYTKENSCVDCYLDSHCAGGKCDKTRKVCVNCLTDADCTRDTRWTGEKSCSDDHIRVMEKGYEQEGSCYSNSCQFTDGAVVWRQSADCQELSPSTYCQDGSCGCRSGYDECEAAGMCVKEAAVQNDQPCDCDFQCVSGYCKGNVCLKTGTTALSATKSVMDITEKTDVTLSIDNNLNEDIEFNLLLTLGSGASMSGSIVGAHDCSGNQCKAMGTLPEGGRKDISLQINPKQVGIINFTSSIKITTETGLQINLPEKELRLTVSRRGDGVCNPETGESQETYCLDCPCPKGNIFINTNCVKTDKETAWGYEYTCKSGPTPLLFALAGIGLTTVIVLIAFRNHLYRIMKERREENERLRKEREERRELLEKQDLLRRKEEKRKKEEKERKAREKTVEDIKEDLRTLIDEYERGRGISLSRIRRKIPLIPEQKVQNALDELVDEGFIVEAEAGFFYKSSNTPNNLTQEEVKVMEGLKELDRGRGVSVSRLTRVVDLSDDEITGALKTLLEKGSIEEIAKGLYSPK